MNVPIEKHSVVRLVLIALAACLLYGISSGIRANYGILYYFLIKSFNDPISPGDTGNSLVGQRANSVTQSLNHFFQSSKYLVMESTLSEFFPDLLNRIHFGCIWWDIKKDDIIWQS